MAFPQHNLLEKKMQKSIKQANKNRTKYEGDIWSKEKIGQEIFFRTLALRQCFDLSSIMKESFMRTKMMCFSCSIDFFSFLVSYVVERPWWPI